jgi:hypothetical protein
MLVNIAIALFILGLLIELIIVTPVLIKQIKQDYFGKNEEEEK